MRWIELVLAVVGGALVAWWLTKFVLAFAVSERFSGAALLKQELTKQGIPTAHLPEEFYDDSIEFATRVASVETMLGHSRLARKREFVKTLETIADLAELWRRDPKDTLFKSYGPTENDYRRIFSKYDFNR